MFQLFSARFKQGASEFDISFLSFMGSGARGSGGLSARHEMSRGYPSRGIGGSLLWPSRTKPHQLAGKIGLAWLLLSHLAVKVFFSIF